jgi:hypothetical protein
MDEEIVHFSIPETKVAQLMCRYPRCNSKLATTASRSSHEKSQNSPKKYSCEKCNFVIEREESIEYHKLMMHHGLKASKLSYFFKLDWLPLFMEGKSSGLSLTFPDMSVSKLLFIKI